MILNKKLNKIFILVSLLLLVFSTFVVLVAKPKLHNPLVMSVVQYLFVIENDDKKDGEN